MAYDNFLEDRINKVLTSKKVTYEAKKMMGGLCYMVDGKMCVGIMKDNLMCRIGTDYYESALSHDHCVPMEFTGRPLKGFVFVQPDGIDLEDDLEYWVQKCLDFNPFAKASKKKKIKK